MNLLKENKVMMINLSKVMLFLLFALCVLSCENTQLEEYEEVSMINLLSNFEKFRERKIEISGCYSNIGHDGPIIYYSEDMMNAHSAMDGILIDHESLSSLADVSQCEGVRVEIRGKLKEMPFIPTNNNVMLVELKKFRDVRSDISCVRK